jgi:uncharacterized protein (TIGR00661 family)
MRVLYGVVGDGMGHATRSRVVIEHLAAQGHQVLCVASGRAVPFLRAADVEVREIDGIASCYDDGAMRRAATVCRFVREAPAKLRRNLPRMLGLRGFAPDLVVTDFESLAARYGQLAGVPVVCVDNQHALSRCALEHLCAPGDGLDLATQRAVIRAKVPGCDRYAVTTFFEAPVLPRHRGDTARVPAIVRAAIERGVGRARPGDDAPVLVYQSFGTDESMLDALRGVDARFVVYGLDRAGARGNVTLRRFSDEGFIDDLLGARAVVCNGGHSLLSECARLGTSALAVPLRHQFEQVINARAVAYHGFGVADVRVTAAGVRRFLDGLDGHRAAFARQPPERNADALAAVDGMIAAALRGRALTG